MFRSIFLLARFLLFALEHVSQATTSEFAVHPHARRFSLTLTTNLVAMARHCVTLVKSFRWVSDRRCCKSSFNIDKRKLAKSRTCVEAI